MPTVYVPITIRLPEDFPPPTPQPTPCRIWFGSVAKGWGDRPIGHGKHQGSSAHRWAWERTHGPVPPGMWVLHHCDNPPCWNVDHLYLGNAQDNVTDRQARGRGVSHQGTLNPGTKVTEAQVLAIRAEYAEGASKAALGRRYDISESNIRRIVRRETWTHI